MAAQCAPNDVKVGARADVLATVERLQSSKHTCEEASDVSPADDIGIWKRAATGRE
jgi:hypothetical protein